MALVPILVIIFIALGFIGAMVWIFFFRNKNKIYVDIYKEGSAGHPFVDVRDKITEKPSIHSIRGKKTTKTNWVLNKIKSFVREPNPRGIDNIKNKKYGKYLYRNGVYVQLEDNLLTTKAKDGNQVVHCDALSWKQKEHYNLKKVGEQWYIKVDGDSYLQLSDELHPSIVELKAIDDDVRSQTADYIINAEEQYQTKAGWLERHQMLVSIGIIVIGLIVVASMGFDFITENLEEISSDTKDTNKLAMRLIDKMSSGNTATPTVKTDTPPEVKPTTDKI